MSLKSGTPDDFAPTNESPLSESRATHVDSILPGDPDVTERWHDGKDQVLGHETPIGKILSRVASRTSRTATIEPPPDGGLKAWTQCAMAWLVVFTSWGYVNSFGTFQAYYTTTLDVSPSTISWIGSIQVWILFFLGAFSGRALDAGLFVPAFSLGCVLQLVGIFTTSLCTKYWQLILAQGICTGVGGGIMFTPSMALLSTYFSKHRGIAVAIATTGNSTGGMIYPLVVTHLLPRLGFGWTVRVLGFMNLAGFAVVLAFMRPRLPPRTSGPLVEWAAFKEAPYSLFVAGLCFAMWTLYFTFYYIASYGTTELGLDYSSSVDLLIILNGVGIVSRLIAGYFADQYLGVLNTLIPLMFLNTILAFCWIAVFARGSLYVFVVLYGMSNAAYQSLIPTSAAALTGDIQKIGTRLGMVFSCISFFALTGPPIGGALLSTDGGGYLSAQLWAAASMSLGAVLVAGARVTGQGWTARKKC